ncbi:MAG: hypothetical protein R2697_11485 [Ilumatobacteraceae bacterium]
MKLLGVASLAELEPAHVTQLRRLGDPGLSRRRRGTLVGATSETASGKRVALALGSGGARARTSV